MTQLELLEPVSILDIYADGVSHVENLGGCFRTVYFTWSRPLGEPACRIVCARIVRPNTSLLNQTGAMAKMLASQPPLGMLPMRMLS